MTVNAQGETVSAEDNVATLRGIIDAINRRALGEVAQRIAPGFVRHDLAGMWPGVEEAAGVQDFLSMLIAAAPDLHVKIEQIWGAKDRVAVWVRLTGSHTGDPLLGVDAIGGAIDINGVNLYRFEEGKVVETWQLADGAGLLRQLETK